VGTTLRPRRHRGWCGLDPKWCSCGCQQTRATTSVECTLRLCCSPTDEPRLIVPSTSCRWNPTARATECSGAAPKAGTLTAEHPLLHALARTLGGQHARDDMLTKLTVRRGMGCVVEAIWQVIHRQDCLIHGDSDRDIATAPTERRTEKFRERLGTISAPRRRRSLTGGAAGVLAFFAQLCAHHCPQMSGGWVLAPRTRSGNTRAAHPVKRRSNFLVLSMSNPLNDKGPTQAGPMSLN